MSFQILLNTFAVVLGVCCLSTFIAIPLSWICERSDLPARATWVRLFSLPYVLPGYLLAISWVLLANPQVGVLNLILRSMTDDPEKVWFNIYSVGGIVFVESSALFSLLFINLRLGMRNIDPSLEEAARLCGAAPSQVFLKITLPLIRRALLAGLLSVALASIASFGVPAMLGGANRIFVVTTSIYSMLRTGTGDSFVMALKWAAGLGVFSLFLVLLLRLFGKEKVQTASSRTGRESLVHLGAWRWPATLIVTVLWILLAGLPLLILLLSSFGGGGVSLLDVSHWNLRAWKYVLFELPNFRSAILNTLKAAGGASLLALFFSTALALLRWNAQKKKSRWLSWASIIFEDTFVFIFSLPGTVLGIALIFFSVRYSFLGLSDSIFILVLAYFLKHINLSNKVLIPAVGEVHTSLIEAARLCGASRFQVLLRIWFPLLKAAMLSAFFILLMPGLSELTVSILLYGPETETLGVLLFQLQEYADRPSAAVVGTLLLAGVLILNFFNRSPQHATTKGQ